MTVKVYELVLDVWTNQNKVIRRVHECEEHPKSYKRTGFRLFRKDKEGIVSKVQSSLGHITMRSWTTNEAAIPEVLENMKRAALDELVKMTSLVASMIGSLEESPKEDVKKCKEEMTIEDVKKITEKVELNKIDIGVISNWCWYRRANGGSASLSDDEKNLMERLVAIDNSLVSRLNA